MVKPEMLNSLLRDSLATDLVVADVGARWGIGDRWAPFGPRAKVFGFDPDEDECARLNAEASAANGDGPSVRYVPLALGPRSGEATLFVTREPACSSLYPPRRELLGLRPDLSVIEPVGEQRVSLSTFDDWAKSTGLSRVDAFKLDTQGSELGVLEGATACLPRVQMLEVEVEFNAIYEGQPLFGDVDRFLRERGFVLWRLQQLVHYGFADGSAQRTRIADHHFFDSQPARLEALGGQLFWGHAYFVPRNLAFGEAKSLGWDDSVRAACAASAFGFADLAVDILRRAADVPATAAARLDALV